MIWYTDLPRRNAVHGGKEIINLLSVMFHDHTCRVGGSKECYCALRSNIVQSGSGSILSAVCANHSALKMEALCPPEILASYKIHGVRSRSQQWGPQISLGNGYCVSAVSWCDSYCVSAVSWHDCCLRQKSKKHRIFFWTHNFIPTDQNPFLELLKPNALNKFFMLHRENQYLGNFFTIEHLCVYEKSFFFSPMLPPVRTNFVVSPPGCGDSVADFWGWDVHEARLRCPNDVSGDMYMKMTYQDGPLSLNLLTTQTMVTMEIFPYQEKFPW